MLTVISCRESKGGEQAMTTFKKPNEPIEATLERHDENLTLILKSLQTIIDHVIDLRQTQGEHGEKLGQLLKSQKVILDTLQEHDEILKRLDR